MTSPKSKRTVAEHRLVRPNPMQSSFPFSPVMIVLLNASHRAGVTLDTVISADFELGLLETEAAIRKGRLRTGASFQSQRDDP